MRLKVLILPLSLVIVVVMVIFYIKPAFSEMMTMKKNLEEKKSQLENLKNQNQKLLSVKSKWESMSDEKTLVASALPDTNDIDSYVSELTSKASRSGILLTNIKMQQKSDATAIPAYACSADPSASSPPGAASPQPASASSGSENLPGPASASNSCVQTVGITLTAAGSWEQILDFFKYLEEMNRISNIDSVTLSAGNQVPGQASSDILQADISAVSFFKKKNPTGNVMLADSLASQGKFNQAALDKLKEVIYSPYAAPDVSPSGERNLFK